MFTLKVCNPNHTLYYNTDNVKHEGLEGNYKYISFYANGETQNILLHDSMSGESGMPDFPTAERVYLINEHGKTVDIFKY